LALSERKKFRITLFEIDTSTGWRGAQKAVVFDASKIGVAENANDVGSAYWTLTNDHAQISKFTPLNTHYEISRWSEIRSRWEFLAAGILNDYNSTEYETTFEGIDYKAVLNQYYTPLNAMSVTDASALNSRLSTDFIYTPEKVFTGEASSSTNSTVFFNTTALSVGPLKITSFDGNNTTTGSGDAFSGVYINDPDGVTTYWKTPIVLIDYSLQWNGGATSAGFDPQFYLRLYASPSASKDSGEPGLTNSGLIGEWTADTFTTSMTSGRVFNTEASFSETICLATKELADAVTAAGYSFTGDANVTDDTRMLSNVPNPLRTGVTYSFQLYAAIKRTSTGLWYRSKIGSISGATDTTTLSQVTVGQSTKDANSIVTNIFNNTRTSQTFNRLRYSSLSVSGSTSTTHTTFTAGEPVLDHIAAVCDLEMGAKTNGDKVVFGINKPTAGASYDGTFKLNLSVSSAASTAMLLRYPENIRAFSFTPGFSRVRNDITVIPTTSFLSGTGGQNTEGTSLIGSSSIDATSVSTNGRLPLVAPKGGLMNAQAAQNEANRLLNSYKVANSKQLSIRAIVDGVDMWNGWDVGDSIRVSIRRGLVDVDEPFVIAGVRWYGETDGHEQVELDLVQGSAFAAAFTPPPTTE
jgi:hypothetical protein